MAAFNISLRDKPAQLPLPPAPQPCWPAAFRGLRSWHGWAGGGNLSAQPPRERSCAADSFANRLSPGSARSGGEHLFPTCAPQRGCVWGPPSRQGGEKDHTLLRVQGGPGQRAPDGVQHLKTLGVQHLKTVAARREGPGKVLHVMAQLSRSGSTQDSQRWEDQWDTTQFKTQGCVLLA